MPRLYTYTLRIETTGEPDVDVHGMDEAEENALQNALQNAEDVVNDALPEGFYCKIDESGEGVDLAAVRRLEDTAQMNALHTGTYKAGE